MAVAAEPCLISVHLVIYESRLELAQLLYADFDVSVRHIVAQPFLLSAMVTGVERKHIGTAITAANLSYRRGHLGVGE